MDLREIYQSKLISASAAAMAHPDYRDDLIRDASRMGIWRRSNK